MYFIAHITASVFINDDERGLHADGRKPRDFALGNRRNPRIAPIPLSRYRHNRTGEDNGDAHLKRQAL